jgi:hypothetical protein
MFCPHCGREISEGQPFCQYCGARIAEPETGAAPERIKTPWEDRENTGFLGGLLATLRQALFTPSDFFAKMPVTGGLFEPVLYALIIGMTGLMFFYFWDILLLDSLGNFMTPELRAASERGLVRGPGAPFAAVLTPFLLIFWLFAASGLLHLFLLLVRGAPAGFEATFRVASYSISPFVFLCIPAFGLPITVLWAMTLAVIGLKRAHGIPTCKASFAVLFPFLFICGIFFMIVALFLGAVAASFGSMWHMYR